jgi:hypothetical protein
MFIYTASLFVYHFILIKSSNNSNILTKIKKDLNNNNKFFNFTWRICSTTHAIIMFSIALYYWGFIFPYYRKLDFNSIDKIGSYEKNTFKMMIGFLWYDSIIELCQTRQLDTLAHHLICLSALYSILITNNSAHCYYSMVGFIAEGSTPWLNLCWLYFNTNTTHKIAYKISSINLMITFFICRVCMATYVLWHVNYYVKEWPWKTEPYIYQLYTFSYFISLSFAILNYYWFYKLIKMAIGGKKTISNDDKSI